MAEGSTDVMAKQVALYLGKLCLWPMSSRSIGVQTERLHALDNTRALQHSQVNITWS